MSYTGFARIHLIRYVTSASFGKMTSENRRSARILKLIRGDKDIFIVLTSTVTLVSGKNGMVTLEVNLPSIFNELLDINKSLNTLRASVGYNGKGSIENSVELLSSNDVAKSDDEIQKRGQDDANNSSDVNIIKVHVNGLEDVKTVLQSLRRTNQMSPDFAYQVKKDDFVKKEKSVQMSLRGASALRKLRKIDKKRDQLIQSFNLKFPGLFDPIRRSAHETRPYVEMAGGTIKTEIVTYPPNFLAGRLKHLLKIKKKQEQEMNE